MYWLKKYETHVFLKRSNNFSFPLICISNITKVKSITLYLTDPHPKLHHSFLSSKGTNLLLVVLLVIY